MASVTLELTNPQLDILDSGERFRIVIAGRRFGKTTLARAEILLEAAKPNRNIVYVAPTYSMAKRLMWKPLLKAIPPGWIREKSTTDLTLTLKTGSRVILAGSKNYDNLRGDGNDLVIFDEPADIAREAWEEAARPSLSDRKGRALFIGTPKGRGNWTYDLFTDPEWRAHEYTTLDGGWVDAEELESAARQLDPRTYRQEYEAKFEDHSGLVYYAFSAKNIQATPVQTGADSWLCWDFNAGERPMAVLFVQRRVGGRGYGVVREFVYTNTNTEEMCEAIEKYLHAQRFTGRLSVTGDYSGNRRESSASKSDYLIIEQHFKNWGENARRDVGYEKRARPVQAIQDRVNALNSMFSNEGAKRVVVDPSCRQLIRGLQRVTWHPNGGKLAETSIGEIDPTDALSYLAYNYHPVHVAPTTSSVRT